MSVIMSVRSVRWPDDREAILEHIYAVHGTDEYELLAATYGETPWFDPADCFVIDGDDGVIAAHAAILPRQLQIGPSRLPTAEISTFGVLEAYQDEGYAGALLDAIHDRMTARGDVLGLSFGPPYFFERWQYEYAAGLYLTSYESILSTDQALTAGRWDTAHSYERRMAARLGANNRSSTVRRFYLDDLPAIQALYDREGMRGHYLIARDDPTWSWQLSHLTRIGCNDPDDFLVAEIEGQIAAYVRVVTQGPVNVFGPGDGARLSVIEAAGDHPDANDALLAVIGHTAQTFDVERIGLFVHPEGRLMQHALARGATLRQFTGAALLRLHDVQLALELLTPTLEQRQLNSRYVGRAYRLLVTTEHEQAALHLGMGDPEIVELEVPSTTLVRLITGWFGFEHLEMGYHERHADLLRVLFPPRDPKIGLADLL